MSVLPAAELFTAAQGRDRHGAVDEAAELYQAAAESAEECANPGVAAEAFKRLAILRHRQSQSDLARRLWRRGHQVAVAAGDERRAAEALNIGGAIELETGDLEAAVALFTKAAEVGERHPALRARVAQNLGIIANVRGDWQGARAHYLASLEAFISAGDEQGTAIAHHNLGMIAADRSRWDEAELAYRTSQAIAARLGDTHLAALCVLNAGEVLFARQQYDEALTHANRALAVFAQLQSHADSAGAYKLAGMVYRDTGRVQLAEARLSRARQLFATSGQALGEAEVARELALLYQTLGRNQEALAALLEATRLFGRVDARKEVVDVDAKREWLEATYMAVVREWGRSIESSDSYTYGHCERVAEYAVAIAGAMGHSQVELDTVRIGAYLHDLGKIHVPHEILNKPGRLTDEEFEVIKRHPEWGLALLRGMELPWDVVPMIRWHHEKFDGTGYPDGLVGDDIPVNAQLICCADVYDALTSDRPYRDAMTPDAALEMMTRNRGWWRPEVFEAFQKACPQLGARAKAEPKRE